MRNDKKNIIAVLSFFYAKSNDLACKVPVYKNDDDTKGLITSSSYLWDVMRVAAAHILGQGQEELSDKMKLRCLKDTAIPYDKKVGHCLTQGIRDFTVNIIQIKFKGLAKTEYVSVFSEEAMSKVWSRLGFGLGNPRLHCDDRRVFKSKTVQANLLEHRGVVDVVDGGRKRLKKNKESPLRQYLLLE